MSILADANAHMDALKAFSSRTGDKVLSSLISDLAIQIGIEASEPISVVNTGLLKAGKSSLFNALVGKDQEFKTADVR